MRVQMDQNKWQVLEEVGGNDIAELIKSFLEAYEIPVLLSQEGAGHFGFPVTVGRLGRVQILVPNEFFENAKQLLNEFNRDDKTENSEDLVE